jgi:HEAT repeat protein
VQMKRWIVISVATVVVLLAAGIWLLVANRSPMPVPTYQGKTEQYWLGQIFTGNQSAAMKAFREMGTNAAPLLLKAMNARDSFWEKSYRKLYGVMPVSMRKHFDPPISAQEHRNAMEAAELIMMNNQNMRVILPDLVRLLAETNNPSRTTIMSSASALMTRDDSYCVPVLIDCLRDTNLDVRFHAVIDLEKFGLAAKAAVPQLTAVMNDSTLISARAIVPGWTTAFDIRFRAAHAVWLIGGERAGPEKVFREGLTSGSTRVKEWSAVYLSQMLPDDTSVVAPLTQVLESSNVGARMMAVHTIGQYGSAAKDAVPALRSIISRASDPYLRDTALHSLKSIDPEAAKEYEKQ